jgi:DNA-binding transcriptional LysR family regulator
MERLRTLTRFWNWLPAFRAVGETSHLPTAAQALQLSPSSLSRSLKQLESCLGCQLFRRANRRLELTQEGERLLAALRDAMRTVHEATVEIQGRLLWGTLHVLSGGVATSAWVLPALLELREQHPELTPELSTDSTDVVPRLLKGQLDIAFTSDHLTHPKLRTETLGVLHAGVYCGPPHPLHARPEVTLDDVLASDFVAPPPTVIGTPHDGWPESLERRVVARVDRMRLGAEACLAAPVLAVLPDLVAEQFGRGELRRLPLDVVSGAPVYAVLRPPIGQVTGAEVLLEAVTARASGG